jgi:hypothetical protein
LKNFSFATGSTMKIRMNRQGSFVPKGFYVLPFGAKDIKPPGTAASGDQEDGCME